jgi:hypothetical protein
MMSDEAIEVLRGSGDLFRDFGYPDADVRQGARVVKTLDGGGSSARQADQPTLSMMSGGRMESVTSHRR